MEEKEVMSLEELASNYQSLFKCVFSKDDGPANPRYLNFINDYNITSYCDTLPLCLNLPIYDHLTHWRTSDGKEVIMSQPYYNKSNKKQLVDNILNEFLNRSIWNYFIKYNYIIDVYLYDKYNWWSDSVISIIFTHDLRSKFYYEKNDTDKNQLVVNIHDVDKDLKPIVTPYIIELSFRK